MFSVYTMYRDKHNSHSSIRGLDTGSGNHNRIVSENMTSWTALTWHIGIKKACWTKYTSTSFSLWLAPNPVSHVLIDDQSNMLYISISRDISKVNIFGLSLERFKILRVIE